MKKVVIIEDQTAIREMISQLLAQDPNYQVVAETGDGQTASNLCLELKPDFVILDIMLPGLNGIEVLRRLSKNSKHTRILVFSGYQNTSLLKDILEAGAHGFVEKTSPLAELKKGIEVVSDGGTFFSPEAAQLLREVVLNPSPSNRNGLNALTAREREILQLIAGSNTTREIAKRLDISTKTADNHRSNLMKKLNLHDVASLTRYAMENNLIAAGAAADN